MVTSRKTIFNPLKPVILKNMAGISLTLLLIFAVSFARFLILGGATTTLILR